MDNSKETILAIRSKEALHDYVNWVGTDPERFKGLVEHFLDDDWCLNQNAAWPLGEIGQRHPELISPYIKTLLDNLDRPAHQAIARNTMRVLQFVPIPEELAGETYERAFNYLTDPRAQIAVRVFAMQVCYNIAEKFTDLAEELRICISSWMEHGSAGFKSRGGKLLKKLNAIIED